MSTKGFIRFATGSHVSANTGVPEWYTPGDYIETARKVLGDIDLDPASSDIAQQRVQATTYYTLADDGLAQEWAGRVWMNPPYSSDLVNKFVNKLCDHFEAGDVTAAVVLVNNATETRWFRRAGELATAVCFPTGRIKFLDENGEPRGTPLQGQALLYFGDRADKFLSAFGEVGLVWSRGETPSKSR
jgi:ParB family chromosome partitioning protein